jgi:DNA-binding response OmpR family regulator
MPRVLIVEDDPLTAELIADALQERGFSTDLTVNGAEALAQLQVVRPDIIVLDLMMPVMHGWDFVECYRDVAGGEPMLIVVVSAVGAITRSMEELGVRAFFPALPC